MERLTFEGNFCDIAMCRENPCPYNGTCSQKETWERLKAYEDTGLTPDDIETTLMNFSSFLCEMTGGMMSKTNYTTEAMVMVANDHFQRLCDECWEKKRAEELLDAEAEGRLLVLPCKVGDTVYVVEHDEAGDFVDDYEVIYFYISSTGVNRIYASSGTAHKNFRPKDFGKTVFLTREEAEAALKGEGNG